MPRDTTAPIRKFLILSNDPAGWIREGFIVSHEGMVWVASVFSRSLFITEQTLSGIKQ